MSMIIWVIAGIIAGWLTGLVIRDSSFGVAGDLIVGLLGGLVGGYLASKFGISPSNWFGTVSAAAIGGVILVWILHLVHPGITTPL